MIEKYSFSISPNLLDLWPNIISPLELIWDSPWNNTIEVFFYIYMKKSNTIQLCHRDYWERDDNLLNKVKKEENYTWKYTRTISRLHRAIGVFSHSTLLGFFKAQSIRVEMGPTRTSPLSLRRKSSTSASRPVVSEFCVVVKMLWTDRPTDI